MGNRTEFKAKRRLNTDSPTSIGEPQQSFQTMLRGSTNYNFYFGFGRFAAELGPESRSNGSGSKTGVERTYNQPCNPGVQGRSSKMWGASHPDCLKAFPAPQGWPDLKNAPSKNRPDCLQVPSWYARDHGSFQKNV